MVLIEGAPPSLELLATLLVATALWQDCSRRTDGALVMRVDLVQSGLDTRRDRPRPSEAERLSQLEGMTPTDGQAELVVWPESALGTLWPMNAEYLERAADRPGAAAPLVLGVPWLEPGAGPEGLGVAAVLLDAQRRVVARHLKTRLLPFAEDRRGLATRRPDRGSPGFVAGESSVLLDAGSTPIGVSICYEVLFPEVARGQVRSGARLLLNLSNESWLGASGRGPDHMLAAAMLRAAETGRPMLRATTIGLTAAIDAQGRVAAALPRGGPGLLRTEVRPAARWTPFVRFGRAPVVLLAVVVVAVELVRSHRAD
ncbi:MAG: apolipoprotein N-acyltransferase [Myxococcota bacterium]